MWLRAAPHPASSGFAGDGSSSRLEFRILQHIRLSSFGFPHSFEFQSCLPMSRQVAPASASSGLAGDGSSSCPESRILQRIQCANSELPRSFALLVAPVDEFPGRPGSCIFRLCRRRIFESPRISRPSALLVLALRVSPRHRSSSYASRCGCEFPRVLHLPALPWVKVFGFPQILFPLAPTDGFPSCLGSRILRLCRPCVFGFPRVLHLRLGQ
jgi:hypothetical protein